MILEEHKALHKRRRGGHTVHTLHPLDHRIGIGDRRLRGHGQVRVEAEDLLDALHQAGARIIAISDVNGGILNPAGIDIPASGMAELKPGGYHVMLMNVKREIKVGETIEVTLVFEKAGEIKVKANVVEAGATGGMNMGGGTAMATPTKAP